MLRLPRRGRARGHWEDLPEYAVFPGQHAVDERCEEGANAVDLDGVARGFVTRQDAIAESLLAGLHCGLRFRVDVTGAGKCEQETPHWAARAPCSMRARARCCRVHGPSVVRGHPGIGGRVVHQGGEGVPPSKSEPCGAHSVVHLFARRRTAASRTAAGGYPLRGARARELRRSRGQPGASRRRSAATAGDTRGYRSSPGEGPAAARPASSSASTAWETGVESSTRPPSRGSSGRTGS